METLPHLSYSGNFSLWVDTETVRRVLQQQAYIFLNWQQFSTPADMFWWEAMTQRCCAIIVVKSGAARAPCLPPQNDSAHQSSTQQPA